MLLFVSHSCEEEGLLLWLSKESACNTGDSGLIPGSGRSPGEGNGNPLQYSCLENSWREEPGGHSPWGCKELDTTEQLQFTLWERELRVKKLKCASWVQHKTQLQTHKICRLDEMDLEEPSYSIESLGLVGLRIEVRNKKAKYLLFPCV